jgi:polyhydroxyalkanoate synthesis regulator phasin
MLRRLRGRALDRLARLLDAYGDGDGLARGLERVQAARGRLEEVEEAGLHFWLLPARSDLRALRRRVHRLRREVRTLEAEIGRLEAILGEASR